MSNFRFDASGFKELKREFQRDLKADEAKVNRRLEQLSKTHAGKPVPTVKPAVKRAFRGTVLEGNDAVANDLAKDISRANAQG